MKFKSHITKEIKFKGILCCIDCISNEELYTCSDDHQIFKWNALSRESSLVAKLPDDFFPTDLNLLQTKGSGSDEKLIITSGDGRFVILSRSGRVEKNITAHAGGAITSGRWSPDGSGLLTAGEDGIIKVWSKSGMLRSTVVQNEGSILCARWSPNSLSIVYCQGSNIAVKPLAANSKLTKWKGHEGLILSIAWSNNSNLIASGGEDCRYKIWDPQGNSIYTSSLDDYGITSLNFSPNGELLAVGGFNLLKLCHYTGGWSHSTLRFSSSSTGSIYGISWTNDGTQISAGCGSGAVLLAHIIEREKICRNLKATSPGRKTIILQDIITQTTDTLDFPDRIINFELGYGHLIVATATQIQIFNENYVNTPIIVDRSEVRIIVLGKKNVVLVDGNAIWVYTYTGRLHLNPRYPGSQAQVGNLTGSCVSLGLDIMAVRDVADPSVVHIFDLLPGASRQDEPFTISSKTPIVEIALCRAGNSEDQYLVYIDTDRDLFLVNVRNSPDFPVYKIGTQVLSVMWASDSNILVGLHDSCYTVWYCPGEACIDPTLIALTTLTHETNEFGKGVAIESFEGSNITFIGAGIRYTVAVKIYCEAMHKCIADGMWRQALQICRLAKNQVLWSSLAAIASKKNQLDISEEAYANALQIDKVYYLQRIKELSMGSFETMAENSVLNGRFAEAEIILLHNKKISEAIDISMRMHRWDRALEIAEKYNETDVDVVIESRKKYLGVLGRPEWSPKFLSHTNKKPILD